MHETISFAVKLIAIVCVGEITQFAARSAEAMPQWEYQVLTKAQILDLGKKDLAAGLNKLGDEGWELAAFDNAYIFKRPKMQRQAEVLKLRLKLAEFDVEQQKERVQWAERMVKKGFLAANQLKEEIRLLKELEIVLEEAETDVKSLKTQPKNEMEYIPKPKEQRPAK
jgi:hypothetical protein